MSSPVPRVLPSTRVSPPSSSRLGSLLLARRQPCLSISCRQCTTTILTQLTTWIHEQRRLVAAWKTAPSPGSSSLTTNSSSNSSHRHTAQVDPCRLLPQDRDRRILDIHQTSVLALAVNRSLIPLTVAISRCPVSRHFTVPTPAVATPHPRTLLRAPGLKDHRPVHLLGAHRMACTVATATRSAHRLPTCASSSWPRSASSTTCWARSISSASSYRR